MESLVTILISFIGLAINIIFFLVLAQLILGLLFQFDVLNPRQPQLRQIYMGISGLLDPLLRPIRNILPSTGGLDFSPMVLLLGLYLLQRAIAIVYVNNFG